MSRSTNTFDRHRIEHWQLLFGLWLIANAAVLGSILITGRPAGIAVQRLTDFSLLKADPADDGAFAGFAAIIIPLLSFATAASLFWRLVRNPVRLWRIRHRGGHLLVTGAEQIMRPIVAGEIRARNPAIVITSRPAPAWIAWANRAGSPRFYADTKGGTSPYLHKARTVILADEDDHKNADMAALLLHDARSMQQRALPVPMFVRVDDTSLQETIETRLLAVSGNDQIQLRLVSVPALVARMILRSGVVGRVERLGIARRTVILIGFTPLIERLLLDLMVGGHFSDGRPLQLIILDPSGPAAREGMLTRWPNLTLLGDPVFRSDPLLDPDAIARTVNGLAEEFGPPSTIIIDRPDPELSGAALNAIETWFRAANETSPAYAARGLPDHFQKLRTPVVAFGGSAVEIHEELLLQEHHEDLARSVHEFYLEGRLDDGEALASRLAINPWHRLPESLRDDNRMLVGLYSQKLRDIGARIVPARGTSISFEAHEIRDLARAEHERWKASRLLAGWRPGPVRDDAKREHPDLISFDHLDAHTADRDAEQIRIITRLLTRFGEHAARDLRIELGQGSFINKAVIADLHSDYPDRQLVFIADIADEHHHATLRWLQLAGYPVQLVVAQHCDRLASSLNGEQVELLTVVTANADRIIVPAPGDSSAETLRRLTQYRMGQAQADNANVQHAAMVTS